jgi:site-specific recombinase XerD
VAQVLKDVDRAALGALSSVLEEARARTDERSPFAILGATLPQFGITLLPPRPPADLVAKGRDDWLLRLRSAVRSESAIRAYRNAVNDLLEWAERSSRLDDLFEEQAIVDYLEDYRRRRAPAPATYHRHFILLRRFMRWLSQREGLRDPFLDLDSPRKPRQEADWLTPEEFGQLLAAAENPDRRIPGLAERDRLVLVALVTTGLRRSELVALDWRDVVLDESQPSLLVRRGKGGKPRRQPLPRELAAQLSALWRRRDPRPDEPVFCGLAGGRLHATTLAAIIGRAASRAGLEKRVTAHTLRHTAATWLRQATGDARIVAEYLGHADLTTVSRYTHVANTELHAAVESLADYANLKPPTEATAA